MYRRKVSFLMFLLLIAAALIGSGSISLVWGIDKGVAKSQTTSNAHQYQLTLKDAQKAAAALKKSKGRMQYTTNDDRWAAAQRAADRRAAAAAAKGKGGGK